LEIVAQPELDRFKFQPTQEFSFETRDKQFTLDGFLTMPFDRAHDKVKKRRKN